MSEGGGDIGVVPRSDFEASFVGYISASVDEYKRMADRAMYQFIGLRIGLIAASAMLPALTTVRDGFYATVAAVIVAFLTGIDTQFRWGEEWRHFRSTQRTLDRLRRDFSRRQSAIDSGRAVGGIATHADNFDRLSEDVETLWQSEADKFFKFRIADAPKDKTAS